MAAMRISALCKRNVIYIRLVWVKHLELTNSSCFFFFTEETCRCGINIDILSSIDRKEMCGSATQMYLQTSVICVLKCGEIP